MSPLRCTGMKSSPTSSSTDWICSGKNTVDSGVREREKRVTICVTICKNPHYKRPSRTDAGFCSHAALFPPPIHVYWSHGPAVCLFIFKNNSATQFDATRGALQSHPSGSFPRRLVCRAQLHMRVSQSESVGSFTFWLLFTRRGHGSLLFSSLTPLCIWEKLVIERKTGASEGIIFQSGEAPAITETMLELFSTDAAGPIKILTEWSERELVPDLFQTLCSRLLCSFLAWTRWNTLEIGATRNRSSLNMEPTSRSGRFDWTPRDKKAFATCDYSLGWSHQSESICSWFFFVLFSQSYSLSSSSSFSHWSQSVAPRGCEDAGVRVLCLPIINMHHHTPDFPFSWTLRLTRTPLNPEGRISRLKCAERVM